MMLSIAMIVKNEEKNLDRCLKSIKKLDGKLSYEIIIIDTGSTDKTIEIAEKYTQKVFKYEWNNSFAEMRNISINKCSGDWILILDADETLENPDALIRFFDKKICNNCDYAIIQFKNITSADEQSYVLGSLARLFKRTKSFCYRGRVHEQPVCSGKMGYTNVILRHYGYSRASYELMEYKYKRNVELLLENLKDRENLVYTYFQLAQTYSMANKTRESFIAIRKAYSIAEKKNIKDYIYVLHFYAREMKDRGIYDRAIELSNEALNYTKEHLDFYYIALKSYEGLGNFKAEQDYIDKYILLYNKIKNGYIVRDISVVCFSYASYNDVLSSGIISAHKLKNYKKVIEYFKLLDSEKEKERVIEVYLYALLIEDRYKEIYEYYKKIDINDHNINSLINVINRFYNEYVDDKSLDSIEKIKGIDKRLDYYIDYRFLNKDVKYINNIFILENYCAWKGELCTELYSKDSNFIVKLLKLSQQDKKMYLFCMSQNYKCIEKLYDFSKKYFMTRNPEVLLLLIEIEDVLLLNDSINDDKYDLLVQRSLIDRNNYINIVYNKSLLNESIRKEILAPHSLTMFNIGYALNEYNKNTLEYIKILKKSLECSTDYKKVIQFFMKQLKDVCISDDMKKEKNNLLKIVENYISEGRINEAQSIIHELSTIFKFDYEILSINGVLDYINAEYEKALINLGISELLSSDDFDTIYNIACVMKSCERNEDSVFYYRKAYALCSDESMKAEIVDTVNALS